MSIIAPELAPGAPSGAEGWSEVEAQALYGRIEMLMQQRGLNPFAVAKKGRISSSILYNIKAKRRTNLSIAALKGIADGIGCSLAFLLDDTDIQPAGPQGATVPDSPFISIPITGVAEAGAYRSLMRIPLGEITAPRSRHQHKQRHFAVRVNDNSMEALRPTPIPKGHIALLVEQNGRPIEGGRVYLVHRKHFVGGKSDSAIGETILVLALVSALGVTFMPCTVDRMHNDESAFTVSHEVLAQAQGKIVVEGQLYSAVRDFEDEMLAPPV